MHVTDWLPTLAHLAQVDVDFVRSHHRTMCIHASYHDWQPIDGVDQFSALFGGAESARHEILLQLDPPDVFWGHFAFDGQAALRLDDWKLIIGVVSCGSVIITRT